MSSIFVYIALGIGDVGPHDWGTFVTERPDKWPEWYDGTTKTRDQWATVSYYTFQHGLATIHVFFENEPLGAGEFKDNFDAGIRAIVEEHQRRSL